jgi:fatty-acyl-CoA synthase
LASALSRRGIGKNDTVSIMAPNTPPMYEAAFGVPMCGAVLNTLNTRLDAEAIAFQLRHGGAKVLLTDREFSPVIEAALALLDDKPLVIDLDDSTHPQGELLGETAYESFLQQGDPEYAWQSPGDEWDAISLNYTSGTTGDPKGVVTHHRGAHLNAVNNILNWGMPHHAVYLWTLPMFHCNGWCFPWTIAERAGVNVCLRRIEAKAMLDAIRDNQVTHMCGAPIVYGMLINAPADLRSGIDHRIAGQIAGAAPPAVIIEGAEQIGIELTHVYGLTETYGPASVCAKHESWTFMPVDKRAERNGRQGVRSPLQEAMAILDPETMQPVPWDGETMGEIMFRGNITMKGYLKNPSATEQAFAGGWFHTGDLAVAEPDGYAKIRDRSKDVIISGGENISSIEVEETLYRHPAVMNAAVVAQPDEKWGETPCAFIELKSGASVTAEELRDFCREHMARYKVPKTFVFRDIPKTSTGKIQKFVLRQLAKSSSAIE